MIKRPLAGHLLKPFFSPGAVAVVGATEDLGKFGGRALQRMIQFGYKGTILPVNPRYKEVLGLPCYPNVRELPVAPDHVCILVGAEHVLATLEDCAARGVPFVTVISSGFAETATERGRELEAQLNQFVERTGVRIMGPNCNGLVNFVNGFALTSSATIMGKRRPAGDVGVVAHSGGVGQVNVMWRAQDAGVNISYQVSCGNEVDLDALDFIDFMIEDEATRVVMVVAERISDGAKFFKLAEKAAERDKPIVMLKMGRTEAGSRAAASHTGAITGSDVVHDAAFRQAGVIRVDDCHELYETAMLLRGGKRIRGRNASALSISGGNMVLTADLGAGAGFAWPEYAEQTKAGINEQIPSFGKVGNPTDLTGGANGDAKRFRAVLDIIAADPNVDVVMPVLTTGQRAMIATVGDFARENAKPVAVTWTGISLGEPPLTHAMLVEQGVPVYRNASDCIKAVRAAAGYGEFLRNRGARAAGRRERPANIDVEGARKLLAACATKTLTERASKQVLAAYGLPVTREWLARTADEAAAHARRSGAPVALKIESTDIPHKTEAGAIRLGVAADAAAVAFEEVMAAARNYAPRARIDGVLVQEMAPAGIEMMLGASSDPVFGPVIVAGLGGIHVEVLRDIAYRVAPVGAAEAADMLSGLRARALLDGVRGRGPADVVVLADLISRLSWLAFDFRLEIAELDVNPLRLFERGKGACVVDALIVRRT